MCEFGTAGTSGPNVFSFPQGLAWGQDLLLVADSQNHRLVALVIEPGAAAEESK